MVQFESEFLVNTTITGIQEPSQVAALPGGGFIVVWNDYSAAGAEGVGAIVRAQRFESDGDRIGAEFVVSTALGSPSGVKIAALESGRLIVTWNDGTGSGGDGNGSSVKAQLLEADGTKVGTEFLVNSSVTGNQTLVAATGLVGGGFVLAWTDGSNTAPDTAGGAIRTQRFDANGAKVGVELLVNTTTAGMQSTPAIAPLASGGFVVTWSDSSQTGGDTSSSAVRMQLFNASGNLVGGEILVNTVTTAAQNSSNVLLLADGRILVTWVDVSQLDDPSGAGVKGQLFSDIGIKIGGEFLVNTITDGDQRFGRTVALPDGGFVATWTGASATVGDETDIKGQRFDANGAKVGAEFLINTTTAAAQQFNHVALLDTGEIVVTWTDASGTGGDASASAIKAAISEVLVPPTGPTEDADTITGTFGDDSFDALGGNDQLFLQQGGNDEADGGSGNDGFYFGAALDGNDDVDGGTGTDTVAIQGNYAALVLAGVTNVEVLLTASGSDTRFGDTAGNDYDYEITAVDSNVAAGQRLTVIATGLGADESLVFNGAAETNGGFRIFAGQGVDTLTGGAAQDGFFFGADGNLTGADRIVGGGGTDSVALRGNYVGGDAVVLQNATFTGIEVLTFLSGFTNEVGGPIDTNGFDYDVTLANGNIGAGQRLDVIASNLRANESARVDGRAELDGSLRILSGAGDDTLFGSAGNDILYGGLGADALDGSAGSDTYLYRTVLESTGVERDTIAFGAGDKIDLSAIDANAGTAGANEAFVFIGTAAFSNVAGQLRATQSAGQWIVQGDANGDGVADLVIAVASAAPLAATDFVL